MSAERRIHFRSTMNARVSVTHEMLGQNIYSTRDVSDGGIFIVVESGECPAIGDQVKVQVQGLPVPAPVLEMTVVRMTADGFGLQFVDQ